MSAFRLRAAQAITPRAVLAPAEITIAGDRILSVEAADLSGEWSDDGLLQAPDLTLAPGLIDLHTHGIDGFDVMGTGLAAAAACYPSRGVTCFMPTTWPAPIDQLNSGLAAMAATDTPPLGARIAGVHLEGPFLAPERPGMANPADFRIPSLERFIELQQASAGRIRRVTLAPELPGAMELISRLTAEGIAVSIGHSDADYETTRQAFRHGATQVTHAFNALRPFHHRAPAAIGAALLDTEIWLELIADGVHLHPASIELCRRLKPDRLLIASDSVPPAGLHPGDYRWANRNLSLRADGSTLADGTLAGSARSLDQHLAYLVTQFDLPLAEAIRWASTAPADSMSWTELGRLEPGALADLVLLDQQLAPAATFVAGRLVWARQPARWPMDLAGPA